MILRTGSLLVGSSFFIDFGSKHAKTCKTIYSITTWAPKQNRTSWPFFAWPTCLLQNEGSCAHGFAWPKKKVPYTRTPGFYKINKSYKNTARLQKHVPKMGLGIQISYWNTVCKGPQAQPFGRGNFEVHRLISSFTSEQYHRHGASASPYALFSNLQICWGLNANAPKFWYWIHCDDPAFLWLPLQEGCFDVEGSQ